MCACRDAETRRLLRTRCPKLRRGDGRWNTKHGRWYYQLELPPTLDGRRRNPLRRGGFASQDAAEHELNQARELLALGANDRLTKIQIADLITATVKTAKRLPVVEEVRRKVRTGQDLDSTITVGQYLQDWLAGRKDLRESTRCAYQGHGPSSLIVDTLRPGS
jgi:hypothetical protein